MGSGLRFNFILRNEISTPKYVLNHCRKYTKDNFDEAAEYISRRQK